MARNIPLIAILLFARQPPIHVIQEGNKVLVVEHHLDVIKCADWVIDLGPGGGQSDGHIVAQGPPEEIAKNPDSITGKYLKPLFS